MLSRGHDYVWVKKMKRSATLSHLFAQRSVSANLLRRDVGYWKSVDSQIAAKWTGKSLNPDNPIIFVYAISLFRG